VPQTTERLRYYDGEYLRSFDFAAEQSYHVSMRRRLHLALGLWGIAYGLNITTDTEGTVKTFAIAPGAAIDAYGRELFVFNPYQLTSDLITTNLITSPADYQLMLQYSLTPTTPPSAGYGTCNGNQQTRFQERVNVLLWPQSQNLPSTEPAPTDALSETPKIDGWAVPIGTVTVGYAADGKTLTIQNATEVNRQYIGARLQRIVSPEDATAAFDIKAAQTPENPPASVEIDSNVYIPDNLIVGTNFSLTLDSGAPTPPATGNLKVAGDLFLQGSIFALNSTTSKWTSLQNFITSLESSVTALLPQVVAGTTTVVIPLNNATDVSTGSSTVIAVPTTFQQGAFKAQVSASIAGVIWRNHTTVQSVRALLGGGEVEDSYSVTANPTITTTGINLNFTWAIAPVKQMIVGGQNVFVSAIDSLVVSYVVIFTPTS
jgi:hypothetical protein